MQKLFGFKISDVASVQLPVRKLREFCERKVVGKKKKKKERKE